jgi:hypothetical protein
MAVRRVVEILPSVREVRRRHHGPPPSRPPTHDSRGKRLDRRFVREWLLLAGELDG